MPVQLNFFDDLGKRISKAGTDFVHTTTRVAKVTAHAVQNTAQKVAPGLAKDARGVVHAPLHHLKRIAGTSACGVATGTSLGISAITGLPHFLPVPTASTKSFCGCLLKSEPIVQDLAGSRERVEKVVRNEMKSSCSIVPFLKENYEKHNLDAAVFNTTEKVRKSEYGDMFPEIDAAQRKIKGGIARASIGLGHCDSIVTKGTLNDNCYALQSYFPNQVCKSKAKCCLHLLEKSC